MGSGTQQTSTQNTVEFEGIIDVITHVSHDTGWSVLKLKVDIDKYRNHPCLSRRGTVTLVGHLSKIGVGERIKVSGEMKQHRVYGPQVEVQAVTLIEPKSATEVQRYLAQNVFNIGKTMAKRIVDRFGANTLTIIDQQPDRLLEIDGISQKRLDDIKTMWTEQKQYRQLLIFCTNVGISTKKIEAIYKKKGEQAIQVYSNDPYALARDIDGIGFKKADEVAKHLGIHELSEVRVRAAAEYILYESQIEGHCFLYLNDLILQTVEFLAHPEITQEIVTTFINRAVYIGILKIEDGKRVFLPLLYRHEIYVARKIQKLLRQPMPTALTGEENIKKACFAAVNALEITLDPTQVKAIYKTLTSKLHVITGGPGTGKTTITKACVAGFTATGLNITLMAPTGRAAKRMTEVIGYSAQTIHRLLFQLEKELKKGTDIVNLQLHGVVIVDEASMMDITLASWLLKFLADDVILIIVGDKDQLPSVGAGAVLRDLLESQHVPSTCLTHIFRQAQSSKIVVGAHKINQGIMPELDYFGRNHSYPTHSDMWTSIIESASEQARMAVWCATELCKGFGLDPTKDCQVLAPMKNGDAGTYALNTLLQRQINPNPTKFVERAGGMRWGVGDKVMQLRNNYDLGTLNGDIGVIVDMGVENNSLKYLKIDFEGYVVDYNSSEYWNDLTLSYASTIHKVQGSEFPMIVMVLHPSHYMLLQRNLLYTGVTRGKRFVAIIANGAALSKAIQNNQVARRNTWLCERLRQEKTKHGST